MRKNSDANPQRLRQCASASAVGGVLASLPAETPLSEIELARVKTRLEGTRRVAVVSEEGSWRRRSTLFGWPMSLRVRFATGVVLLLLGASAGAAGTFVVMKLVVGETQVVPGPSRAVVRPSAKPRRRSTHPLAYSAPEPPPTAVVAPTVATNVVGTPQPERLPRLRPPREVPTSVALQGPSLSPPPVAEDKTGEQARLVAAALAGLAQPAQREVALSQLKDYVKHYPEGVFASEARVAIITALTRSNRQSEALQVLDTAPELVARNADLLVLQAELLVAVNCGRSAGLFARSKQLMLTPVQSERADFGYARALQACGRQAELERALNEYRSRHPQGSRIGTVTQWLDGQKFSRPSSQ